MMTSAQIQEVKRRLLSAQISYKRSELNEESLYVELHNFFQRLKKEVLTEFKEYWNDDFMFQAHADLILAPIHEAQKEYTSIIQKHIEKEWNISQAQGKRYVELAAKKAKKESVYLSDKSETTNIPINGILKRERELFGTSEHASHQLATQSFTASERTMNRIDGQINQILTDGYKEGWGQNKVAESLEKKFEQLKTWESRRIARTEIHNAHNEGINKTYEDLNVGYTQWGAAQDDRTRDSHIDIDGEIIPIGGKYSNDLGYPGDTSGPLEEWINCRCVQLPFIIPDGYIAPPFHPFREDDLIPTLDYWNQEELIQQATEEASLTPEFTPEPIIIDRFQDYYSKREQELSSDEFYNVLRSDFKQSLKAKIYHTEKIGKISQNELFALEKYYPEQYNTLLNEISPEVDYYRLSPAEWRDRQNLLKYQREDPDWWEVIKEDATKRLEEYDRIARDKNILAERVEIDLGGYDWIHQIGSDGEYSCKTERFIKYNFKDRNYSIYLSENAREVFVGYDWQTITKVRKMMDDQGPIISNNYQRIFISNQTHVHHVDTGRTIGGWSDQKGNVVIFHTPDEARAKVIIAHEGGHNIEPADLSEFIKSIELDMELRMKGKVEMTDIPEGTALGVQAEDKIWISNYAEHPITSKKTDHIETWAECVAAYLIAPEWFQHNYRVTYNYIDRLFWDYKNNFLTESDFKSMDFKLNTINKIEGYDKYRLSDDELVIYEQLKAKDEKEGGLKFRDRRKFEQLADRREFNEMWNQILREGGDPHDWFSQSVRYEKLYKEFKDWVPKGEITIKDIKINTKSIFENKEAFKLTSEEKNVYKQLDKNSESLSREEKRYSKELSDKVGLNRLHNQLIKEGLDNYDSSRYIQLYSKYKEKWNLPELSLDLKFKSPEPSWKRDSYEVTIGDKYALSKKESRELDTLQKKKLFSENGIDVKFTNKELTRMEELQNKDKFNYLYYLRKGEGGLNYNYEKDFKELYSKLKRKLKLPKSILTQELPKYNKPHIEQSNETPLRLRGTTEDGSLPGGRNILDLFTIDVKNCTPREQAVTERWLGNDYSLFRDVTVRAKGDLNQYIDYVLNEGLENNRYLFVRDAVEKGRMDDAVKMIRETYEDIQHDLPLLTNLLENNCVKFNMKFFRVEERLHLGDDPKKGDRVTFEGMNSVAVTKQGAEHFAEVSHRDFEWMLEIEAPAGTTGAYVANLNQAEKFAREMEFLLSKDTLMEIVSISDAKKTVKLKIILEEEANKSMIRTVFDKIIGVVS